LKNLVSVRHSPTYQTSASTRSDKPFMESGLSEPVRVHGPRIAHGSVAAILSSGFQRGDHLGLRLADGLIGPARKEDNRMRTSVDRIVGGADSSDLIDDDRNHFAIRRCEASELQHLPSLPHASRRSWSGSEAPDADRAIHALILSRSNAVANNGGATSSGM
jgi:hypothetical protein